MTVNSRWNLALAANRGAEKALSKSQPRYPVEPPTLCNLGMPLLPGTLFARALTKIGSMIASLTDMLSRQSDGPIVTKKLVMLLRGCGSRGLGSFSPKR